MFDELRGMYAFALVDTKRGRAYAGSDPPWYQAHVLVGGAMKASRFASEVGALVEAGFAKPALDQSVLGDFPPLGHTRTDRVFVRGVHELAPGHSLIWDKGRDFGPALVEARDRLPACCCRGGGEVAASSARRLSRPTPCCGPSHRGFPVGGVDSGAVAARAAARGDVRTFTVSFPEVAEDEGPAASLIAKHLGVSHDEVPVMGTQLAAAIAPDPSQYGLPNGGTASYRG
jgi:asparagine synthase (glutamine-hydrolysing)